MPSLLDHDTFSAIAKARHLRRPRHYSVSGGSPSVAQRTYGLTALLLGKPIESAIGAPVYAHRRTGLITPACAVMVIFESGKDLKK